MPGARTDGVITHINQVWLWVGPARAGENARAREKLAPEKHPKKSVYTYTSAISDYYPDTYNFPVRRD